MNSRRWGFRIVGFLLRLLTRISRFVASLRPVRWIFRLRAVRFTGRVVCRIWYLVSTYLWWPIKRRIRRIRRAANRRDVAIWLAAWAVCGWMGWGILKEGFMRGLMLGMVVALAFVAVSFRSPVAGLLIWLTTSRFLTLFIAVKPLKGLPVFTGDRYCLLVLLAIYVLHSWRTRNPGEEPNKLFHAMMILFVSMTMLGVIPAEKPKLACQSVLDIYAVPCFTYMLGRRWVTNRKTLALVFTSIMFVSVYFSALGVPEYYTGRSYFARYRLSWLEPELGTRRAQGPADSPSEFGLVVLTGGLLALTGLVYERRRGKQLIYLVVLALAAVAVAVTLRRSVYASALLALLAMLAVGGRMRKVVVFGLIAGVVCGTIFWGTFSSSKIFKVRMKEIRPVYSRAVMYATSWEMFKEHPVFGVGIFNFRQTRLKYLTGYKDILAYYGRSVDTNHNNYLRILTEGGLVSLLPYLAMLVLMFTVSLRAYRRTTDEGLLGRGGIVVFWALWVAVLQDAMTEEAFWSSRYLTTLWFFYFGAVVGVHLKKQVNGQTEPSTNQPVLTRRSLSAVRP